MKYTKYRKRDTNGQMKSMWTPQRRKLAKKLYVKDGMSLRKVAAHFECAHAAVQKLAEEEGWIRKRRSDVNDHADEIKRLYLEKLMSSGMIAKKLGFTEGQITHHIQYYGGYFRSLQEGHRLCAETGRATKRARKRHKKAFSDHLNVDLATITWGQYRYIVNKFTSVVLYRHGHHTKRSELRSINNHIDHIYPVRLGFMKWSVKKGMYVPRRKVLPLTIICHPANLQLLASTANLAKGDKRPYPLAKLQQQIKLWNEKNGEAFPRLR